MKIRHLYLAVLFSALTSSSLFAELRHVEMRTLGMD